MALIVDASVAIKWFVEEPGWEAARQLWRNERRLLAPDLIVPEACNAMWRKVRAGQATAAQAEEAVARMQHGVLEVRPTDPLAARAMAVSLALDHPAYDCFYLALAEREQSVVVTADQRLIVRLSNTRYEPLIRRLRFLTTPRSISFQPEAGDMEAIRDRHDSSPTPWVKMKGADDGTAGCR
jgi:predicted nucleic acid-binding protein